MFRKIRIAIVLSALSLTAGVGLMNALGQDNDRVAGTTASRWDDDGFDFGWVGLVGLVGLAGLIPRDKRETNAGATIRNAGATTR